MAKEIEKTNRNLPKVCDDCATVKDHYIALPQLIRSLGHARVGRIALVKV